MKITVIGAGIAGCSIVKELNQVGYQVTLIDEGVKAAGMTSANQAALSHPYLSKRSTRLQLFTRFANRLTYIEHQKSIVSRGAYRPMKQVDWISQSFQDEILASLGFTAQEARAISLEEAYPLTGLNRPGIWFSEGAIYDIRHICEKAIEGIFPERIKFTTKIHNIKRYNNLWCSYDEQGSLVDSAHVLILASGLPTKKILESLDIHIPLRPVRGQLSQFSIANDSALAPFLPTVALCGKGYSTVPTKRSEGAYEWQVGSTYDEGSEDLEQWQQSHTHNKKHAMELLDCKYALLSELETQSAFVGVRCMAGDQLPLIGAIPENPGLFIACAYGARGVMWSTIGAKLIKTYVDAFFATEGFLRAGFFSGAPAAVEASFVRAVDPARFLSGALGSLGAFTSNSKPTFPVS